jgi:hypothetical protein
MRGDDQYERLRGPGNKRESPADRGDLLYSELIARTRDVRRVRASRTLGAPESLHERQTTRPCRRNGYYS